MPDDKTPSPPADNVMQHVAKVAEAGAIPGVGILLLGYMVQQEVTSLDTSIQATMAAISSEIRAVQTEVTDLRVEMARESEAGRARASDLQALERRVEVLEGRPRGR